MCNLTNIIMVGKVAIFITSILSITAIVSAIIVNHAYKNNKSIL